MTTLFVEQLTVIDFSYFHPTRGIVGESWIMDVELEGDLDDNGMVFDFTHVKKQIKSHVDKLIDHKFVVAKDYPLLDTRLKHDELALELKTESGKLYRHLSPVQAVAFVPGNEITIANATPFIHDSLMAILPKNVTGLNITLREEVIDGAFYHYSHGLKKHFGDCQRIAHGHRSRINVFRNGQRDSHCEQSIAERWKDIYLITKEDIAEKTELGGQPYYIVRYSANQGLFELTIPVEVCDILSTDSTVELIAEHLCQCLKKDYPNDRIKIRAFEGVQKGAVSEH
ncbi:6-pyruvoyl trahydropterin synthase family protein [Pleionea sediminis]|uniref:6-pyruvoyl trahydropterin synthase family protein n=1 Tax=Pleionea sediminis TaxID=2569479 RepID=UPI001185DC71|nr:6-carboxytetrahydropterin synthase [Pleionea sediminis]